MSARKKINSLLRNKQFLMILSLVIAVLLWCFVAMVISPSHTTTIYNVPVTIEEKGTALEKLNLSLFEEEQQTINITVTGKRYLVSQLDKDDFSVSVPLAKVMGPGEYKLEITPIYVGTMNMDFNIVNYSKKTMTFNFDYLEKKEFSVQADISELRFSEGYTADLPNVIMEPITIEGPKSEIDSISKVVAVIQPKSSKKIKESLNLKALIIFYDENGEVYTPTYSSVPKEEIEITVPVVKSVTLPLKVDFENQPSYFKKSSQKYTVSPKEITVTGNTTHLEDFKEIIIGTLDYSQLSLENSTFKFEIELPSGLTSIDNLTEATVNVDLSEYKEIKVDVSKFEIINAPQGINVQVISDKIKNVKIVMPKALEVPDDGKFYAEINIDDRDYNPGTYNVNVAVKCSSINKLWSVGSYNASIRVDKV